MKRPYSQNAKIELVDACTGMSKLEAQKEFVRRNPELEKHESFRFTSQDRVRLDVSIAAKTFEQISELQDILSHTKDVKTMGELIARIVEEAYDRHSPKRKAERSRKGNRHAKAEVSHAPEREAVDDTPAPEPAPAPASSAFDPEELLANRRAYGSKINDSASLEDPSHSLHPGEVKRRTRYIPMSERSKVPDDGEGCVYTANGRRCCSKKFLQLDHVVPFAEGGSNIAENLRWICGAHNRFRSARAEF